MARKYNQKRIKKGDEMKITEKDLYDADGKIHFDDYNGRICLFVPKLNSAFPLTMLVNGWLKKRKNNDNN